LVEAVLELLAVCPGGRYVDATAGGGGHTEAILKRSRPDGRVLAIDRDASAVRRLASRLAGWGSRCEIVQGRFGDMRRIAERRQWKEVDGILLDLGMCSDQLDDPERGFSFTAEGALDMRMDCSEGATAADLVADLDEDELAALLRKQGEERRAGRIAREIVRARAQRPIRTTGDLAAAVERAVGGRRGQRLHPATRTFQALRRTVNDEDRELAKGLEAALQTTRPGGRIAVISFQSLEDRAVKQGFAQHVAREIALPQGGTCQAGRPPWVRWVTRRPATASEAERASNPRARSAKLRVVERRT
jgi:16S rRNA (cytosine1402-N4)-methyltransferase